MSISFDAIFFLPGHPDTTVEDETIKTATSVTIEGGLG
jgi:hypothetical protein